MKLTIYDKYDNSTKKGFMIDPNSYYDELKAPYDLKLEETKLKIRGHLEQYLYVDDEGVQRSACWVSTSHGKDSIVIVHLTLLVCREMGIPMVPLFLNNTLDLYPEEPIYWKLFNKRYGLGEAFKMFIPPKDENGNQITVWTIREANGEMENFRSKGQMMVSKKTGKMVKKYSPDCCETLKRLSVNEFIMNDGKHLKCSFDGRRGVENNNRSRNLLQRGCTYETNFERPRKIRTFIPIAYWTDEDRDQYLEENIIPICPSYDIHNLESGLGCRHCTGFKQWIVSKCRDYKTEVGMGDLVRNLDFMKEHQPDRMKDEIKYSLRKIKRDKIKIHPRALEILNKYLTGEVPLTESLV